MTRRLRRIIASRVSRGTLIYVLVVVCIAYFFFDVTSAATLILVGTVTFVVHLTLGAVIDSAASSRSQAAPPLDKLEALGDELDSLSAPGDMPRKIALCHQALALVDRSDLPEAWARVNVELGDSLWENPQGEKAQNLELAIFHYEQALEIYTRDGLPSEWARTQYVIANAYKDRIMGDKAQNLEEAISHHERALEVYTREDSPRYWAMTQNKLAAAYSERIQGEKAENMEQVISRFEQALEIYTREDFPEHWAWTQNNLANAYAERIRGEKAENIEQAISHFEQALEVYTRKDFPSQWAVTHDYLAGMYKDRIRGERAQNIEEVIFHFEQTLKVSTSEEFGIAWLVTLWNLAAAYKDRIKGERAQNIEEAISRYEHALEVRTREDFPDQWATTQFLLAIAYRERIRGDKAENLEEAISRYEQVLEVHTRRDYPVKWARVQYILAIAYSDRIRGDKAQNLEDAIRRYEQALEVHTQEDFPVKWASIQNSLANAYKDRIRGNRAHNQEEAVSRYEQALEVYTREDFPVEWARTQDNLVTAYSNRIQGDRARNLEEAISRCEQALEVRTRKDFPADWARSQNNLATAYAQRIRGDRAENREEAISHCEQALEVYTRQDFPVLWAWTQENLANAYSLRVRGDAQQSQEEAISRYEQTLEIHTREDFPMQWARTQHNMANVYAERIRGDRAQNVEDAISRCKLALEVYTREDFPVEWARIQDNLGSDYSDRIKGDRARNLEEAIYHYEQALEVRTRKASPADWAMTTYNLANAYSERIRGSYLDRVRGERTQNLERAISRYEQALEVYTKQDFPVEWATIQNSLAIAYSYRVRGDRVQNVEEAIFHHEQALEVNIPNTLPQSCRNTALPLGYLLYDEGRFAEARRALTTAHEAVEAMRGELQREGSKQRLAEENADLYARLVNCCLIEGDEGAAFEYAVAGKGRAFVDMLATTRFDLSAAGDDDPEFAENLRQARELRQQIDNLLARLTDGGGGSPEEDGQERGSTRSQMRADLRSLQEQDAAHWEEMSYRYPALTATQQAPTLTAEEARALAEELEATLVECYRHAGGWCAFVVTADSVGQVPLPAVDDDLLERMTGWLQRIESPTGRGRLSYGPLRRLHQALITPLQGYLPAGGRVILAPFAQLHLLPLGAALDPITGRYTAEDHTLAFAPNLAALCTAQQAASSAGGRDGVEGLLSVAYPDVPESDHYLPNVLPEAEAVARHFARVTPLYEEAATPDAVLSHARGQDVVHLGCHGTFDAEAPQQSGLMLSGGWLTVQRIITELRLDRTRLTTIGACRSGQVEVRQGEEHVGLTQAMMSAGARAVVASLWRVNDAATRTLFEVFYAEAASGDSAAGSLADAGALVRGRPGWEHPYYWASFQVSGLSHGPYEPGLSHLSDKVLERIEDAHWESVQKRGGLVMDETTMVRDSLVMLEQMGEEPEAVLDALKPADRKKVLVGLGELSGQAAGVRTEAELLGLAEAIHSLVEETPALADLLLEPGTDLANQRTVPPLDDTAYGESQSAMEHAAQIRNRVVECKESLERNLQDETQESS